MQKFVCLAAAAVFVLALAGSAAAQAMPYTGARAVSADVGVASPSGSGLNSGFTPQAGFEYYMSPRTSLRVLGGAAWNDFTFGASGDRMRPAFVDLNGVYNWELGRVHPFATAGFGLYSFNVTQVGFDQTATEPGVNVGGGAEFFLNRHNTIKGELLYHGVRGTARSAFGPVDTSFWTTTFGIKHYF